MGSDLAQFTLGDDPTADPLAGNDLGVDPLTGELIGQSALAPAGLAGTWNTGTSTGGAASNTPAQSNSVGASLLGWLGLGTAIAQAATGPTRTGTTTRPAVNQASMFGTMTTTTLLVIVAVFVGVVFLLNKK